MTPFIDALKPVGVANGARARSKAGFYPALTLGDIVIWQGSGIYRTNNWGADARQMAADDAATVLACHPGSLMAEQLQRAVDTGEPIAGGN
jgi:hypothetical protein